MKFARSNMILVLFTLFLAFPVISQAFDFTNGNFYASQDKTIFSYDSDGRQVGSIQVPGANELRGLAFGPDDLLYAVSTDGDGFKVFALDSSGQVQQTYSYTAWIAGNISWGKIAFDQQGTFYVGTYPGVVRFTVGAPNSGAFVPNTNGPFGIYDVDVLPSGNLLVADSYSIFELTSDGSPVRSFASLTDIRGVAYDASTNQVFATELGNSGSGYFRLLRYDYTTAAFQDATNFWYGDDIVVASEGRLVVGSRTQAPGIFNKNLTQLGSFEGNSCRFVTQFILRPGVPLDFNRDGKPDLLWQNRTTGDVSYWQMNGTQYIGHGSLASGIPLEWRLVGAPDFNDDGYTDLLWQNRTTGDVSYWIMHGTQRISYGYVARAIPSEWEIVATPDMNQDNRFDLLWRNQTTGAVVYWIMNGTNRVSYGTILAASDTNWQIVATLDINRDGHTDILWRNRTNGDVVYWLMNKTTWVSFGTLAARIPLEWEIAGRLDMNGDGGMDLLWRNQNTGKVVYWLMNRATQTSYGTISGSVPLDWQNVGLH